MSGCLWGLGGRGQGHKVFSLSTLHSLSLSSLSHFLSADVQPEWQYSGPKGTLRCRDETNPTSQQTAQMEKVGKKKNKSLWEKINAFAHPPLSFANQVENVMNAYPSIFFTLDLSFQLSESLILSHFFSPHVEEWKPEANALYSKSLTFNFPPEYENYLSS